jgi:hypothetical protein
MPKTLVFRLIFAGNSLLFIFILLVAFSIFPLRIFQSQWLLNFSDILLSSAGFSLVALVFLAFATYLDPDNLAVSIHVRRILRLACLAAFAFLLLIPLQFYTANKIVSGFRDQHVGQLNQTISKAFFLAQKVKEANTFDQLQEVMKVYQATQLPEQERSKPLNVTKTFLLGKIREAIALLKSSRNMNIVTQKAWEQYQVAIRNSLLAFTYFLAFAALGQRRDSQRSFLQDVMDSSLNKLYVGLQNRESRVASATEQQAEQSQSHPLSGTQDLTSLHRQGLMDRGWLDDATQEQSGPEALLPQLDDQELPESTSPPYPSRRKGLFSWLRPGDIRRRDEPTSFLTSLADQQEDDSSRSGHLQNPQEDTLPLGQPLVAENPFPTSHSRTGPQASRRQKISDLDYFEQLAGETEDSSQVDNQSPKPPGKA